LIIDNIKNLRDTPTDYFLTKYTKTSDRFAQLLNYNILPFVRRTKEKGQGDSYTGNIAINSVIIKELYKYGITKEQLPNLKALADHVGGKYHKSDGKMVLEISQKELEVYFEEE
jgi:hypothetical protein